MPLSPSFRSLRLAPALPGLIVGLLAGAAGRLPANEARWSFSFGPGPAVPGSVSVSADTVFRDDLGYGFEPGAAIVGIDRGGGDAAHRHFCTSDRPFFFSVAAPEGNYRVTVTLGDAAGASTTTIKAELRRLMVEKAQTSPGQFTQRTFIVNLRTPQIPNDGSVKLKPRELTSEAWDWDRKLTLEFNDRRPCLVALTIARADVPTVYLAGDSTVCDQPSEPYASWGQMLPRFFGPSVAIANHAESGESLRGFLGEKRLDKLNTLMKPGDYLFIQMGHNDQKEKGPGVGAFTTYKSDLLRFVAAARAHGATPVIVTSMNRRTFDAEGRVTNSLGDFPEAARQAAREQRVALIDLNAMSKTLYEALGPEKAKLLFPVVRGQLEGTHHNNYGSYELAQCVIEGIRANHLDLVRLLAEDAPVFDPSRPDPVARFDVPPSPQSSTQKPYGN